MNKLKKNKCFNSLSKKILKIKLFIFLLNIILISIIITLKNKNTKIAICVIGKKENLYKRIYQILYKFRN